MAALQSPTINTGQLASTSKLDEPRERTGHWVHKGTDNPEKREFFLWLKDPHGERCCF